MIRLSYCKVSTKSIFTSKKVRTRFTIIIKLRYIEYTVAIRTGIIFKCFLKIGIDFYVRFYSTIDSIFQKK